MNRRSLVSNAASRSRKARSERLPGRLGMPNGFAVATARPRYAQPMCRTETAGRVQCVARVTCIYAKWSKWNASMQHVHIVGVSLSCCAMRGTTERTRAVSATKKNLDEVWSENHSRTAQRAKNQSATAKTLQEPEQRAHASTENCAAAKTTYTTAPSVVQLSKAQLTLGESSTMRPVATASGA